MAVPESATPAEVMRAVLAAAADGDWATIARYFDPEVQLWVNGVQPEPWHGARGFAMKVGD